jgi:2-keto-4-pentenoate hydratase
MMAPNELDALAVKMRRAQDSTQPLAPLTTQHPGFDLQAAYAVAHRMHTQRLREGERAVGRKIGFTNVNMWPQYGVHQPIWGHVYERTLVRLAAGRSTFSLAGLAEPRIEPEIVFGLRSPPPAGADAATVLACVEWVAPAFEIVQSHFPGWKFQAPDTVADGGLHGALLLGEPVPVASLAAPIDQLAGFTLDLSCDGTLVETGRGAHVLGSPLNALAHLASVLAGQPQLPALAAGEVITTGTVTGAYPIAPGQRWQAQLHGIGLGGVSVEFTT